MSRYKKCTDCKKWRRVQTAHLKEDKIIENDIDEEFLQIYTCQKGHLLQENVFTEGTACKLIVSKLKARSEASRRESKF